MQREKRPPLHRWQPGDARDFDLRITRSGDWLYLGSPILRPKLVKVLSRVLIKEENEFFLISPSEKLRIKVDDAPFLAVELEQLNPGPDQRLVFRTNVDDAVIAGPDHLIKVTEKAGSAGPSPYVTIRDGLDALITRSVFYELAEIAQPIAGDENVLGVMSSGQMFPLGRMDD
ncbi:MAG: DUF1285 domain-containing protein [Gammaproteobacteria bacterium]